MKKGSKVYPEQRRRVYVGMSGGVDSSVSAALLKEAGYDVTGVFIKVWNPDWLPCEWREERRDAMRVAAHLGIPFITLDLQEEYKKGVVDYMISEYKAGRTPNPDVMCNKEVKFGHFLKKAREMGAEFIATGHYAQISLAPAKLESTPLINKRGTLQNAGGEIVLKEGADKNKDQSYFLYNLTQSDLKSILFPVGHLQKDEVRKLAKKFKLPTAEKKDSQGICFIGKVDMKEFLEHYIESKSGNVCNETGEIIGTHDGAVFYTIGQRHGFTILKNTPHDAPYYIVGKNTEKNVLTVSQKPEEDALKRVTVVTLEHINWISELPVEDKVYSARIRYRQDKQECKVTLSREERGRGEVVFTDPQQGVSAGQSVVIFDGEVCLGGGVIASSK
ncbi:MAG: tRNA 2-thiouridine(34) synthase MnmA [bacterium]|nr:tRNA 2-thiouridine(34) synthase MnmA [bacterium]